MKHNILGVTNPSFELFLLLHYENVVEEIIIPDSDNIVKNKKINKRRYIEDVFREKAKISSKTNKMVGELANNVLVAIKQEEKINNDIVNCKGKGVVKHDSFKNKVKI